MDQKIILAGLWIENDTDFLEQFEETKGLAQACHFEIVDTLIQKRRSAHPATFFGEGKVAELKQLIQEHQVNLCLISSSISPSQMKTLKEMLGVEVMDRNDCILEIFARRAQTKQAKLQVELAYLKHRLPYVMHTVQSFSRMGGGSGMKNKGEGEKQLELDRRKIETQIKNTARALKEVKKNHETTSRQRNRSDLKLVSLVGYTNAGKSTLMNALLDCCEAQKEKKVYVKDMLFATLDTTIRKLSYQGIEFLLSDTVGFVSHLPHELVDAFHSTLEEVCQADLILQVVDESSDQKLNQMQVTQETLKKLHAQDKAMIVVHNKCDLNEFKKNEENHVYISAATYQGCEQLLDKIVDFIFQDHVMVQCKIPYDEGRVMAWLQKNATLLSVSHQEEGYEICAKMHQDKCEYIKKYVVDSFACEKKTKAN